MWYTKQNAKTQTPAAARLWPKSIAAATTDAATKQLEASPPSKNPRNCTYPSVSIEMQETSQVNNQNVFQCAKVNKLRVLKTEIPQLLTLPK